MKRIGRSKVPYAHQLASMAENLAEKLNKTVYIQLEYIAYKHNPIENVVKYNIFFVPGFNSRDCTQFIFNTWPEFLDKYFSLMKESVNG